MHSLSLAFFFGYVCVSVFLKELWICHWAALVLEAGPPRGRAGARGGPTAAERISVFKAFENKLLQFPGFRVGVGRGVPGGSSPRVQAAGAPLSGKERVRRQGCGEKELGALLPLPSSSLVRVLWAPCLSQTPAPEAGYLGRVCKQYGAPDEGGRKGSSRVNFPAPFFVLGFLFLPFFWCFLSQWNNMG